MADRVICQVKVENPLRHPAVAAWNRMTCTSAAPSSISRLNKGHSVVYRLEGLAPDGGAVIAKLCWHGDVEKARDIYQRLLPLVPRRALIFYGSRRAHFNAGWMFTEDGGRENYTAHNPQHRSAVSTWLGALHASLAGHFRDSLPQLDLGVYWRKLSDVRDRIAGCLSRMEFTSEDHATLCSTLRLFDRIETRWDQLNVLVHGGPRTFLHGDLAPKNILIRETADNIDVFPIDWETAGWGPPAVDLAFPIDLSVYLDQARRLGAIWSMPSVEQWSAAGRLLRHIAAIDWASHILEGGWPPRAIRRIKVCLPEAVEAVELGIPR